MNGKEWTFLLENYHGSKSLENSRELFHNHKRLW